MGNLIFKDPVAFKSTVYNELGYTLNKPLHCEHFLQFLIKRTVKSVFLMPV